MRAIMMMSFKKLDKKDPNKYRTIHPSIQHPKNNLSHSSNFSTKICLNRYTNIFAGFFFSITDPNLLNYFSVILIFLLYMFSQTWTFLGKIFILNISIELFWIPTVTNKLEWERKESGVETPLRCIGLRIQMHEGQQQKTYK